MTKQLAIILGILSCIIAILVLSAIIAIGIFIHHRYKNKQSFTLDDGTVYNKDTSVIHYDTVLPNKQWEIFIKANSVEKQDIDKKTQDIIDRCKQEVLNSRIVGTPLEKQFFRFKKFEKLIKKASLSLTPIQRDQIYNPFLKNLLSDGMSPYLLTGNIRKMMLQLIETVHTTYKESIENQHYIDLNTIWDQLSHTARVDSPIHHLSLLQTVNFARIEFGLPYGNYSYIHDGTEQEEKNMQQYPDKFKKYVSLCSYIQEELYREGCSAKEAFQQFITKLESYTREENYQDLRNMFPFTRNFAPIETESLLTDTTVSQHLQCNTSIHDKI